MILILAGILAIFYLILAIYNLDWAILVIIFGLPSYLFRFAILGVPMTFLEVMILIAFAIWLIKELKPFKFNVIKLFQERKSRQTYPFKLEIILFIIISWIALAVVHFDTAALGVWKAYFFEPLLMFILVINVLKKEGLSKIFWALAGSALGVSLFAIYQKITGQFITNPFWAAAATRRAVSFFGYPNAVGLYLGPIIMLMIGFLVKNILEMRKFSKADAKNSIFKKYGELILLVFSILASLAAIYSAKSEGAFIGLAVAFFVYGILANKKMRWTTLIITTMAVVGICSYQPVYTVVKNKITFFDLSGQIRQQQWKETWAMLAGGKWFWGAGLSGYQLAVAPYHQAGIFVKTADPNWLKKVLFNPQFRAANWQPTEIYMYPHNIFLNFWTELGILGALLMSWVIIKYLVVSLKISAIKNKLKSLDKYLVLGLTAAMITIVVHGLVDVPYFKNDLAVMFWVLMAMLSLFIIENRKI